MAKKRDSKRRSRGKDAARYRAARATAETRTSAEREAEKASGPARSPVGQRAPFFRFTLAALLGVVLLVGVLGMPAMLYRGDANAVRMGTLHVMLRGSPGIGYDEREFIPAGFLRNRGQYFYENDAQQRFYSKYGVLQSLLYLPAMWAAYLEKGGLRVGGASRQALLWLNVNNIVISLFLAVYLLLLAHRFTRRPAVALCFVLCCLYASLIWYYLRAQTTEIFQLWFFFGFCYHFFRWVDGGRTPGGAVAHYLACTLYGTLFTLTKAYYGLVFPLAWVALQLSSRGRLDLRRALREAVYLGGPAAVAAGLVLLQNRLTYGGWLDFGYFQARPRGGFAGNRFGLDLIPRGLYMLLIQPSRSVFVYFPLLIPAAFGFRRAWRRNPLEVISGALFFVVFLLFVSAQSEPHGGWCIGPRYLVFVLPLLGLPAIPALEWVADNRRRLRGGAALSALLALMLAQVWLNTRVNQLEFHADWHIRGFLDRLHIEEVDRYFDRRHAGMVFADLAAFKQGKPFPPFEMVKRARPRLKAEMEAREREYRSHWILRRNYYLFEETQPGGG